MNTKGLIASSNGRPEEALGLIRRSLEIALENDTPSAALRAYANLANEMFERDRYDESTRLDLDAIALAHGSGGAAPNGSPGCRSWDTRSCPVRGTTCSTRCARRWSRTTRAFERVSRGSHGKRWRCRGTGARSGR